MSHQVLDLFTVFFSKASADLTSVGVLCDRMRASSARACFRFHSDTTPPWCNRQQTKEKTTSELYNACVLTRL